MRAGRLAVPGAGARVGARRAVADRILGPDVSGSPAAGAAGFRAGCALRASHVVLSAVKYA